MMETVKTFVVWLVEQIPAFLMSEPIIYFVGIALLLYIIKVLFRCRDI